MSSNSSDSDSESSGDVGLVTATETGKKPAAKKTANSASSSTKNQTKNKSDSSSPPATVDTTSCKDSSSPPDVLELESSEEEPSSDDSIMAAQRFRNKKAKKDKAAAAATTTAASSKTKKTTKKKRAPLPVASLSAQQAYEDYHDGNKDKIKFLMAMGYPTVTIDEKLLKDAKAKRTYTPTRPVLIREANRRAFLKGEGVKCDSFLIPRLLKMLEANPITDEEDIRWVKAEIGKHEALLKKAVEGSKKIEKDINSSDQWTGIHPWLMLIEVMATDSVQTAFKESGKWVTDRLEIDGRNSDQKPPEWYQIAAEKYNDPKFEPETGAHPQLHEDFAKPIKLTRDKVPFSTPDKIKDKQGQLRGFMLKLISNWEKSGNGSCQRHEGDERFGVIDDPDKQFVNGDNRAVFAERLGYKSYVLYGWHVFDQLQLLQTTLARLDSAGDIGHGIFKTSTTGKKSKSSNGEAAESAGALTEMAGALSSLAKTGAINAKSNESNAKIMRSREHRETMREIRALINEKEATNSAELKREIDEQIGLLKASMQEDEDM